ncbi:hypothetical protein SAMN05443551_2395 [Marivita hallyeonensis]|uniref:Uncharacterized protein n=1 Tax=Marivita hallyeonensis TaxID=996342 RepID=A0A1M5TWQ4_9RHOB|nr:hypothetical protein SAMN05443551_2395 [Marivita hallyeonensis]
MLQIDDGSCAEGDPRVMSVGCLRVRPMEPVQRTNRVTCFGGPFEACASLDTGKPHDSMLKVRV